MRRAFKHLTLALYGGVIYYAIEAVYKSLHPGGIMHWSMAVIGGMMFLLIGGLNNWLPWDMSLAVQGLIGMAVITWAELVAGLWLNLHLGLGIWDYSGLPGNVLGQICLPFCLAWFGLAIVAIVLDDWLRYYIWGDDQPRYVWF